jgi:hypothetical protein
MSAFDVHDTILGTSFLAIQAAMKFLDPYRINLEAYKILVINEGELVLLIANDKNAGAHARRNFGLRHGFEVEMSAHDLSMVMSTLDQANRLEEIQGRSFLAIRAAAEVFFQRVRADLARYKIEVERDGDVLVITFDAKDKPPSMRGSLPGTPGFSVELNPRDLTVLDSYFAR